MEKIVDTRGIVSNYQNILKMFITKDMLKFVKNPHPATYHFRSYLKKYDDWRPPIA